MLPMTPEFKAALLYDKELERHYRNLETHRERELIGAAQEAATMGLAGLASALYRAAGKLQARRLKDRRNRARSRYTVRAFLAESKPWDLDRAKDKTRAWFDLREACNAL